MDGYMTIDRIIAKSIFTCIRNKGLSIIAFDTGSSCANPKISASIFKYHVDIITNLFFKKGECRAVVPKSSQTIVSLNPSIIVLEKFGNSGIPENLVNDFPSKRVIPPPSEVTHKSIHTTTGY